MHTIPSPPHCEPGPSHPSPHPAPAGILPSAFSSTSLSAPPAPAFPVPPAAAQPVSVCPASPWVSLLAHLTQVPGQEVPGLPLSLHPFAGTTKLCPAAPLGQAVSAARAQKHSTGPALPFCCVLPITLLSPIIPANAWHCPCKQPCRHPDRPGLCWAAPLDRQFHLPRLLQHFSPPEQLQVSFPVV